MVRRSFADERRKPVRFVVCAELCATDDDAENVADRAMLFEWVAQRYAAMNGIDVAAPIAPARDHAGGFEVDDNLSDRALGDPHLFGEIA